MKHIGYDNMYCTQMTS